MTKRSIKDSGPSRSYLAIPGGEDSYGNCTKRNESNVLQESKWHPNVGSANIVDDMESLTHLYKTFRSIVLSKTFTEFGSLKIESGP